MTFTERELASLRAAQRVAEKRWTFFSEHRVEFLAAYPDEFVAVHNREVIDHDTDLMALASRIEAAGHLLTDVWVEFMEATPRNLIL